VPQGALVDAEAPGCFAVAVTEVGQLAGEFDGAQADELLELAARLLAGGAEAQRRVGGLEIEEGLQDGHVRVRWGWHFAR
jgi:hypothetical protein